jgi:homoserine kinase
MADAFKSAGRGTRVYRAPLESAGVRLEPLEEQEACA